MSHFPALLEVVCREQQNNFDYVITGDELWLFLHYPNESVWAGSRDEVPVHIKQIIGTDKCLISVLWSVNWIHSFVDILKGESYNSSFFGFVIVPGLVEDICSGSRRRSLKDFYVHLDSACPHNLSQANNCLRGTKAQRMPQLAYSQIPPRMASSSLVSSNDNSETSIWRTGRLSKAQYVEYSVKLTEKSLFLYLWSGWSSFSG
jgi:hypothetical protein